MEVYWVVGFGLFGLAAFAWAIKCTGDQAVAEIKEMKEEDK